MTQSLVCKNHSAIQALTKTVNKLKKKIRKPVVSGNVVQNGSITFLTSYTNQFSVDSSSLVKSGDLVSLNITSTKINGNSLLNTTFNVGSFISPFVPMSPVGSVFSYNNGGSSDIGGVTLDASGNLSITSGNNASIANSTSFTISLLFLVV